MCGAVFASRDGAARPPPHPRVRGRRTTDQVGNPWDLTRSAGGSSGGSGAALAARMLPAANRQRHRRIAAHPVRVLPTSTINHHGVRVDRRHRSALVESRPRRTDGALRRRLPPLLAAMVGPDAGRTREFAPRRGRCSRHAIGTARRRTDRHLTPRRLGRSRRRRRRRLRPRPSMPADASGPPSSNLQRQPRASTSATTSSPCSPPTCTPTTAASMTCRAVSPVPPPLARARRAGSGRGDDYAAIGVRRRTMTAAWAAWISDHADHRADRTDHPCRRPVRGTGYERFGHDVDMIALTHFWDWTGFPVVALPAGLGADSGLPVGVSLIGPAASDWHLLDLGDELQTHLVSPTGHRSPTPSDPTTRSRCRWRHPRAGCRRRDVSRPSRREGRGYRDASTTRLPPHEGATTPIRRGRSSSLLLRIAPATWVVVADRGRSAHRRAAFFHSLGSQFSQVGHQGEQQRQPHDRGEDLLE